MVNPEHVQKGGTMKNFIFVICTVFMMALTAGCGGGGGGSGGGSGTLEVSGVAAAGAPLVGTVTLKDSSAQTRQRSATIANDGAYSLDVTGLTAPFLVQATGVAGNSNYTLYSMASGAGTCNINPLTNLALTMANAGQDLSGFFASPTPTKMQTLSIALHAASMTVQNKFALLFTLVGASPVDIITDPFQANSQGLDLLFDLAAFNISNGNLSITNRSNGSVILPATAINNGLITGSISSNMLAVFKVSGTVKTSAGTGISSVTVTATGSLSPKVKTDTNGNYSLSLPIGSYILRASQSGYTFTPSSIPVSVSSANLSGKDFTAVSTATGYTVSGAVKTATGAGIPGVTVLLTGTTTKTSTTGSNGTYSFTDVTNGSYTLTASLSGYSFSTIPVTVNNSNATGQNVTGTTTGTCNTLSISPASNTFPPGIGSGSVTVTADSSCQWAPPVSNSAWLTASAVTSNSGGTVNYSLTANTSNSSRNGQITIGPKIFNVTQEAQSCTFSIFPSANLGVSSAGASGNVNLTAASSATGGSAPNCAWVAVSNNSDWIIITGANSGSGDQTISYTVLPNTGNSQRTGTITIAGKTFTVTQAEVGVTGTWNGTLNIPGAGYTGCISQTVPFSLALSEDAAKNITGYTSNSRTISSGNRSGNSINVTLNTDWGSRGPYVWTWNGTNMITGSMAYFCYSLDTGAILSEGTETFSVTRN